MSEKVYSSPNSMVWEYLEILHRTASQLGSTKKKERQQDIALCILLAITVVETFINLYFQVLVNKPGYASFQPYITDSLTKRKSLEFKITHWPRKVFDQGIDMSSGVGKRFTDLKEVRNKLMHFSDLHGELLWGDTKLRNLSDITFYETLTKSDAWNAYYTSLQFIVELLKLGSKSEDELARLTVHWTAVSLPLILTYPRSK